VHARAAVDHEGLTVTKSLSGEMKNDTAPERSSGICTRPRARSPTRDLRYSTSLSEAFSSLRVEPGAMQLTRMPSPPTSRASVFVKPRMPALLVT
jgi:hypothetical protein